MVLFSASNEKKPLSTQHLIQDLIQYEEYANMNHALCQINQESLDQVLLIQDSYYLQLCYEA